MGEHFDEPVLLIKAAWGGHSLYKNFRSPSAGIPEAVVEKELADARKRVQQSNEKDNKQDPLPNRDDIVREYGVSYRNLLKEVREVQKNHERLFPALTGRTLELTGFVWFQGFNDIFGAQDEYASNMRHFINDVRKDLQAPGLPFVIGALGQNGSQPATGGMLVVREAQLSMNDVPEFQGNVKAFPVDVLVDKAAEEMFPNWQKNPEWVHTGSDRPYHYYGSAIWFNRIGKAMGQAMVDLRNTPR
jgi:alpha-galactosidase